MAQYNLIETVLDGSILEEPLKPSKNSWEVRRKLRKLLSKERYREVFKYKYEYDG